jgi:hypothetical protein
VAVVVRFGVGRDARLVQLCGEGTSRLRWGGGRSLIVRRVKGWDEVVAGLLYGGHEQPHTPKMHKL